jgi:nucleotide-binding universal stress UspA family protein
MPTIKKILFPVDFSARSIGAARYVESLAGRFDAEIMLLHVVENGTNTLAEELLPAREIQLDGFLADELKYFTTGRTCVVGQDPAQEIIDTARSWQPDLVMMPTHGFGLYRRLLLGSVAAKVLHDLECPVWTDVHSEQAPPLERITCRRVLCAIDLEDQSGCLLRWGAFLAGEYQADLRIVHAIPAAEGGVPGRYLDSEFVASIAAEAKSRIATLQSSCGTKASVEIEVGDPAKVVADVARAFAADILIIGRHDSSGVDGHLRQNSYGILRDSPCPVISI